MNIEIEKYFPDPEHHPILFEDIHTLPETSTFNSKTNIKPKGMHLYVLCHGF